MENKRNDSFLMIMATVLLYLFSKNLRECVRIVVLGDRRMPRNELDTK
jgi:hypothetical protein